MFPLATSLDTLNVQRALQLNFPSFDQRELNEVDVYLILVVVCISMVEAIRNDRLMNVSSPMMVCLIKVDSSMCASWINWTNIMKSISPLHLRQLPWDMFNIVCTSAWRSLHYSSANS